MQAKLKRRRSMIYNFLCWFSQRVYKFRKRVEKFNHQLDDLAGEYDPTEPY